MYFIYSFIWAKVWLGNNKIFRYNAYFCYHSSVSGYLKSLIEAASKELSELKESTSFWTYLYGWKKDFYLKARLKNYLILYDFLSAPEKARKYIEQSLKNIK